MTEICDILRGFEPIHYQDTFTARPMRDKPITWEELREACDRSSPWWANVLLYLRNLMVGWTGLKTGKEKPGDTKSLFEFCGEYVRTDDTLAIGEDDRHLDFRVVFRLGEDGDRKTVALTTAVRFKLRLGRVYFFFVKPFHKLIVGSMVRRMGRILEGR